MDQTTATGGDRTLWPSCNVFDPAMLTCPHAALSKRLRAEAPVLRDAEPTGIYQVSSYDARCARRRWITQTFSNAFGAALAWSRRALGGGRRHHGRGLGADGHHADRG